MGTNGPRMGGLDNSPKESTTEFYSELKHVTRDNKSSRK